MNAPLRDSNVLADLPPPPLRSSADWLAASGMLAADFAAHAAERERAKSSAAPQLDAIKASGLSVLMIPR
ncbi:hypothetical protein ACO1M1_14210, partial [Staphylococcus aureus]